MVLAQLPLHLREILQLYEGQVETGSHSSLKPELPASHPSHYPTHHDQASKIQKQCQVNLKQSQVNLYLLSC